MQTLRTVALHLFSIGSILLAARWLIVRPALRALKETEGRMDAGLDEMRKIAAGAREDMAAMDRLCAAAADMLRQESRLIIEKAAQEMRERALQPFTETTEREEVRKKEEAAV